ncbi:MAG: protein phosphatase 2C domain-containing protein [Planctomycetota bacterium]|nr:protein phosphatase 2C domain-containing protein [Planctomycetota bacterium]
MPTQDAHLFLKVDLDEPLEFQFCGGRVVLFTHKSPVREGPSQDGAMLLHVEGERGLLVVADGAGGHEGGERAAEAALLALQAQMGADPDRAFRERVLSGFEHADRAVTELRIGAASTLAAVAVGPEGARSYHVGDSGVLIVGQRGRRKHESISHSPVGYAVEAGVIGEAEALHHEDRHLVSNMLGAEGTHISMSSVLPVALRDTVLVASDGLFDNVHVDEVIERIRKGPLLKAGRALQSLVQRRMQGGTETRPSKPDDVTFLLYRRA